ncbi:MAG: response regulator transcription factor [Anaerolineales bacterium]
METSKSSLPDRPGESLRLLLVDDHNLARSGLRSLVATWPEFEIVGEASQGEEAIRAVEKLRPDIVLMDFRMPGMNGVEATRAIKAQWPDVKVAMLTVYVEYRAQAAAAGADEFLDKYLPTTKLRKLLVSLGQRGRQESGSEDSSKPS